MLNIPSNIPIFRYTPLADLRNGCDGLSGMVRSEFAADPLDGSLFRFVNRRRDRIKILRFDGSGYWLYYTNDPYPLRLDLKDTDEAADAAEGLAQAVEASGQPIRAHLRRRRCQGSGSEALPEHLPRYEVEAQVPEALKHCPEHGVSTDQVRGIATTACQSATTAMGSSATMSPDNRGGASILMTS